MFASQVSPRLARPPSSAPSRPLRIEPGSSGRRAGEGHIQTSTRPCVTHRGPHRFHTSSSEFSSGGSGGRAGGGGGSPRERCRGPTRHTRPRHAMLSGFRRISARNFVGTHGFGPAGVAKTDVARPALKSSGNRASRSWLGSLQNMVCLGGCVGGVGVRVQRWAGLAKHQAHAGERGKIDAVAATPSHIATTSPSAWSPCLRDCPGKMRPRKAFAGGAYFWCPLH